MKHPSTGDLRSDFPRGVAQPALRALASIGVHCIDEAARFSESQLLALHGMGPKAVREIKQALAARGKSLAGKRPAKPVRRTAHRPAP